MIMRSFPLAFAAICLGAGISLAQTQGLFEPTDRANVVECIIAVAENREKFQSFGCMIERDRQEVMHQSGISNRFCGSVLFEDRKRELRRCDVVRNGVFFDKSEEVSDLAPVLSFFVQGKKTLLLENGFATAEDAKVGLARNYFVPDPWMVPLASDFLLDIGEAGEYGYWEKILDDGNLLWAEEDKGHVRGEWRFGSGAGECFIQVYFAKKIGNMPELVRYIRPKDRDEKFAKFGKTFVSETEVKWEKFGQGFVPKEVRSLREEFWSTKAGTKSTASQTTRFWWSSTFVKADGKIDSGVFIPGELGVKELQESFR